MTGELFCMVFDFFFGRYCFVFCFLFVNAVWHFA